MWVDCAFAVLAAMRTAMIAAKNACKRKIGSRSPTRHVASFADEGGPQ
jgi:hypothetical protein